MVNVPQVCNNNKQPRNKSDVEAVSRLSPLQQGILFHALQAGDADPYLYQYGFTIEGTFNQEKFAQAWLHVAGNYQALRAEYRWEETDKPLQIIFKTPFIDLDIIDIASALADVDHDQHEVKKNNIITETLTQIRRQKSQLKESSYVNLRVFLLGENQWSFYWSFHHIAIDGWSLSKILGDLLTAYQALLKNETPNSASTLPYTTYVKWITEKDSKPMEQYWAGLLSGFQEKTPLPLSTTVSADNRYADRSLLFTVAETDRIKHVARTAGVTVNTLVQAAWGLLLSRYADTDEIVFGVTTSGRSLPLAGVDTVVGLCINTLPCRMWLNPQTRLNDWLQSIQQQNVNSREFEYSPLSELTKHADIQDGDGLFDSILVFENYPVDEALKQAPQGLHITQAETGSTDTSDENVSYHGGRNNYPISVIASLGNQLKLVLSYHCKHYSYDAIANIEQQLKHMLLGLLGDDKKYLGDFSLLVIANEIAAEKRLAAVTENNSGNILDQFRKIRQQQITPELEAAIAVSCAHSELSWYELDEKSNQLANQLRATGVVREVVVGVLMSRRCEWLVSLLAVMKAGGIYLPIDINWPADRIEYMVSDARIALVLHHTDDVKKIANSQLAALNCNIVAFDKIDFSILEKSLIADAILPQQTAYIIYTSGSTGAPKGVMVSHQALAIYTKNVLQALDLNPIATMGMVSTIAADLGHTVLFGALYSGRTLHLIPEDAGFDPDSFAQYMRSKNIGILKIVPGHLKGLLQAQNAQDVIPDHALIVGGEACDPALVKRINTLKPACRIINHYGPTETTIGALTFDVPQYNAGINTNDDEYLRIPIGQALAHGYARIVDSNLHPQPQHVRGELFIGGAGVARGYLHRPALTAERFVPDSLGNNGERVYRTGDGALYDRNGNVDYLGRLDNQVKIRGYRVEPDEIAQLLKTLEHIADACIITRQVEGEQHLQLAAYVVIEQQALSIAAIKEQLVERLPDYMVPASITQLDVIPRTANGKIDKKSLPDVQANQRAYVAPSNDVEQKLADVWAEVLKTEKVGITDNFFELGGDSILSLQIIARARKQGIKITPKQLFDKQTVKELAAVATTIEARKPIATPALSQFSITPIQANFFERDIPQKNHFNQAVLLLPNEPLLPAFVEQVLQQLALQHDSLRATYTCTDNHWQAQITAIEEQQKRWQEKPIVWQKKLDNDAELQSICTEAQQSLDITRGELLRGLLITLPDHSQRLLVAIHHLAVDGVSWRILLEDFQNSYRQLAHNKPLVLTPASTSFAEWSSKLTNYAQGELLVRQLPYWVDQLSNVTNELPCKNPHGSARISYFSSASTVIDATTTQQLLKKAPAAYRTQINDLLLTALARVLSRWMQQDSVLIQLEGHGREDIIENVDLSRTLGWFSTLFPIKLHAGSDSNIGSSIKAIKEQLRAVPQKGIGYGLLRYLGATTIREQFKALPQARITFNYLGQFDQSFEQHALLIPAQESAGESIDNQAALGNWLTINGQVYDGSLQFSWSFSNDIFAVDDINQLAADYGNELKKVVTHCLNQATPGATPSDFPLVTLNQIQLDDISKSISDIEDVYPLSPVQQGMLFHSLYDPSGPAYVNQLGVDILGLNVEKFCQAWRETVAAHDVLRAAFVSNYQDSNGALQIIQRRVDLPITILDWRNEQDRAVQLETYAREDRQQGFDLTKAPLLRLSLLRIDDDRWYLLYTNHHIITDGWSTSHLFAEVLQRYEGLPINKSAGSYRDYMAWLQQQDKNASQTFWQTQLAEFTTPVYLSNYIAADESTGATAYGEQHYRFDNEITAQLIQFSKQQHVTVNTVIQAAWLLLLQRYSGEDSVCFGATVSGRPAELSGIEQQLGLFINTLPVMATIAPQLSVSALLQKLQQKNSALREFEYTPLADIQRWAGNPGQALFDSILVFENYPIAEALQKESPAGLLFGKLNNYEQTNYGLTIAAFLADVIALDFNYEKEKFSDAAITRIIQHLTNIVAQLIAAPEALVDTITLYPPQDGAITCASPVITAENHSVNHRSIVVDLNVHAELKPDDIALIIADEFSPVQISWQQLNHRVNQLANHLIAQGVTREVLVGLSFEPSLNQVVGLLAILKAGGAYVPLDPKYPADRLDFIIADSGIKLLLTESAIAGKLVLPAHINSICIDKIAAQLASYSAQTATRSLDNSLAYLIYTSGSTGKPKAVAVNYDALCEHCWAISQHYAIRTDDRQLLFASISFDAATEQLLAPLVAGAAVVTGNVSNWTSEQLCQYVRDFGISILDLPPIYLNQHINELAQRNERLPVRVCIVGGEAWHAALVKKIQDYLQPEKIINAYGPTEAVISPIVFSAGNESYADEDYLPIGLPIGSRTALILANNLHAAPTGFTGELYIGGAIARGYFGRPGLTAERFVPNPYASTDSESRLYRTGDLVHVNAKNVIEFTGRADNQIKVRGFRIEPGEIETAALASGFIDAAAVVPIKNGKSTTLALYLVPQTGNTQNITAENNVANLISLLKNHLQAGLPEYMVPSHYSVVDSLPLTINGKLDVASLPPVTIMASRDFVAPDSYKEKQLAAIWQDVLGIEQVSLHDNFFELGGDSIISIQLVGRARQQGLRFTPRDIFQHQTLQALAAIATEEAVVVREQKAATGEIIATPIMESFFEEDIPNRHYWNQAVLLQPAEVLNSELLEQAMQHLVLHHDILRLIARENHAEGINEKSWGLRYREPEEQQALWKEQPLVWQRNPTDEKDLVAYCNEAHGSLNLEHGSLCRLLLATMPDQTQRLLLTVHHLVIDGVSWRILLEDLQTAYRQLSVGKSIYLGNKTSAFNSWSFALQDYARSDALVAELGYWQSQLSGVTTELPLANKKIKQTAANLQSVTTTLDAGYTRQLLQQSSTAYRTSINDLLLAALTNVLTRWLDQASVLIQLEGHGREELFTDLDTTRTLGWFTAMYPVRLNREQDLALTIKSVKESLRAIPNKGIGYGVLRYLGTTEAQHQLSSLPQPAITFNYLGQFDQSFDESALFKPADESSGSSTDTDNTFGTPLTINSKVYAGKLSVSWSFGNGVFDTDTIQSIADELNQELISIIQHCGDSRHFGVTPSDFPLAQLSQKQLDALPISANEVQDIFPLAPMQEGLLLHTLLEPGSGIYFMQESYLINSTINPQHFDAAWREVIRRHDVLRASFWWDNGKEILQIIHKKDHNNAVIFMDWSDSPSAQHKARIEQLMRTEREAGFDLKHEPPFRLKLIRIAPEQFYFIMSSHHMLMDAWCNSLLVSDFFEFYTCLENNEPIVSTMTHPYRDFIALLANRDRKQSAEFWRKELEGFEQIVALPFDRQPGAQNENHSDIQDTTVLLNEEYTARLRDLAIKNQLTINTFAQAAWALVLHCYSGQQDVLFGVTVAGRPLDMPHLQQTVGLFINSIPLRCRLPQAGEGVSVQQWLSQLLEQNLRLREHEYLPLVDIQSFSPITNGARLFDTLFVYESAPFKKEARQGAVDMGVKTLSSRTHTNYPITVVINPGEILQLTLSYDCRYFDAATIDKLLVDFRRLIIALVDGFTADFARLPLVEPQEFTSLLEDYNHTIKTYPLTQGYAELFEAQVKRSPQKIAASCLAEEWTYQQLNQKANCLAHQLIDHGVLPDSPIALLAERGLPLLGMINGVFKAAAGYVPLDPNNPASRLALILKSCLPKIMVCDKKSVGLAEEILQQLPHYLHPQLLIWETVQQTESLTATVFENPGLEVSGHHLAYVIYTSGSTGVPKGVMVEQAGMLNNQLSKIPYMDLVESDVIAQTASQGFDISVWQFLTAALCGAQVDIVPHTIAQDPFALLKHVQAKGISILESVPALISGMLMQDTLELPSLRYLLPTGEAMPPELACRWIERYNNIELINAYGPAECSDDVALHRVLMEDTASTYLPIGEPTDNNRLFVLNSHASLLPLRATGELCIAGTGVSRGYLGDPARTAQTFIPNEFATTPGERLYRSGDLVRRRHPDGIIEYVGRTDYQVKIRGYRIELGEVQACLQSLDEVLEAIVHVQETANGPQLIGYIVPVDENIIHSTDGYLTAEFNASARKKLLQLLPEYMVPVHLVIMPSLPLTPNGKLDRKALPAVDINSLQRPYLAPGTLMEKSVAAIWQQILDIEKISVTDNFFELGGHSLLVIRVVAEIKKELNIELGLHDFMFNPTIAKLSSFLRERDARTTHPVVPLNNHPHTKTPLFCIHPAGGSAYPYYPVALELNNQRPVYGIMSRTYVDADWIDQDWNEMVNRYVGYIRDVQPHGPYLLLGWSLGGLLAIEITHKLEQQGEQIQFLGLLDSFDATQLKQTDNAVDEAIESTYANSPVQTGTALLVEDDNEGYLRFIAELFSDIGYDELVDQYLALKQQKLERDDIRTAMTQWVADRRKIEVNVLESIRDDLRFEKEMVLSDQLKKRLSDLADNFAFTAIAAKPHMWWATREQSATRIAQTEVHVLERLQTQSDSKSVYVDSDHEKIISHQDFLQTLKDVLKKV